MIGHVVRTILRFDFGQASSPAPQAAFKSVSPGVLLAGRPVLIVVARLVVQAQPAALNFEFAVAP